MRRVFQLVPWGVAALHGSGWLGLPAGCGARLGALVGRYAGSRMRRTHTGSALLPHTHARSGHPLAAGELRTCSVLFFSGAMAGALPRVAQPRVLIRKPTLVPAALLHGPAHAAPHAHTAPQLSCPVRQLRSKRAARAQPSLQPPPPVDGRSSINTTRHPTPPPKRATRQGRHVVFGKVLEGRAVVDKLNATKTGRGDRPVVPVVVANCGVL